MTTFVTRDGWEARPPRSVSYAIVPKGTAIHWVGSPVNTDSHARCAPAVRGIQNYHMGANGWADVAYTLIGCPHDYVFAGRGAGVRTAANGTDDANGSYYAACGLLGQGQEPSEGMLEALGWGVRQLRKSGAGQYVTGHSTIKPTSCPGTLQPHIGDIALRAEDEDMALSDEDVNRIAAAVRQQIYEALGLAGPSTDVGARDGPKRRFGSANASVADYLDAIYRGEFSGGQDLGDVTLEEIAAAVADEQSRRLEQ